MDNLHNKLCLVSNWYKNWHNDPDHHHVHWLSLIFLSLTFIALFIGEPELTYNNAAIGPSLRDSLQNGHVRPVETVEYRSITTDFERSEFLGEDNSTAVIEDESRYDLDRPSSNEEVRDDSEQSSIVNYE